MNGTLSIAKLTLAERMYGHGCLRAVKVEKILACEKKTQQDLSHLRRISFLISGKKTQQLKQLTSLLEFHAFTTPVMSRIPQAGAAPIQQNYVANKNCFKWSSKARCNTHSL